jgi:hypothetical protein
MAQYDKRQSSSSNLHAINNNNNRNVQPFEERKGDNFFQEVPGANIFGSSQGPRMLHKRHTMVEEDRKEPLNKYNQIDD